jgi:hypothetical protein
MDEMPEKQQEIKNPPHRFLPGESGNPAGRPKKGNAWADIRNDLLSASKVKLSITIPDKDEREGFDKTRIFNLAVGEERTLRHAIIVRQIQNALSGDNDAIRDLMNREEGMPRQAVDLGGQRDNPLNKLEIVVYDGKEKCLSGTKITE